MLRTGIIAGLKLAHFVCLMHKQTCGDIYKCRGVLSLLDKQFGLHSMLRVHLGIASNVVEPWAREEKKSIGSERSPGANIPDFSSLTLSIRTFKATSEKEE